MQPQQQQQQQHHTSNAAAAAAAKTTTTTTTTVVQQQITFGVQFWPLSSHNAQHQHVRCIVSGHTINAIWKSGIIGIFANQIFRRWVDG
jgi:hypothetical protein